MDNYQVTVDYAQTIEEMLKAGRYNHANADINSQNFLIAAEKKGKKEKLKIHLIQFTDRLYSENVLEQLNKMGLRAAELPELLALAAEYPELQREFPIIALGSVWQEPDRYRWVAYLWGKADQRGINLTRFMNQWPPFFRFAAVPK